MDNLRSILMNPAGVNVDVKAKASRLVQNWAQISESKPEQMGYIIDTYKSLKSSGLEFPDLDPKSVVSAALVETLTAPEWSDSDVCMRCRTPFTTFNRKHHCRNCGQVFCQECSSKTMSLPWFGVGQDVRVCDGCFTKKAPPSTSQSGTKHLGRSKSSIVPSGRGGLGSHQRSSTLDSAKGGASHHKREEDDLALAIKLSLESSANGGPSRPGYVPYQPSVKEGRPTKQSDGRMMEGTDADDDPDLAAAIAASLRDYAPPAPSAPLDERQATPKLSGAQNIHPPANSSQVENKLPLPPSLDLPAADVDAILTFSQDASAQERFARQNGRWQSNPAAQRHTQELYEQATTARPRLARTLDEATRRHGVLTSMHDKLSEAVRLYDSLLDSQISRPAVYGAQPTESDQAYAMQYSNAHHSQQPQQYLSAFSDNSERKFYHGAAPLASNAYPSLPSQFDRTNYMQQPSPTQIRSDSNPALGAYGPSSPPHSMQSNPQPYMNMNQVYRTNEPSSGTSYFPGYQHLSTSPQQQLSSAPQNEALYGAPRFHKSGEFSAVNHISQRFDTHSPEAVSQTQKVTSPSEREALPQKVTSPMNTAEHGLERMSINGSSARSPSIESPLTAGAAGIGAHGGPPHATKAPLSEGGLISAGVLNGRLPATISARSSGDVTGWRDIPITQSTVQSSPMLGRDASFQTANLPKQLAIPPENAFDTTAARVSSLPPPPQSLPYQPTTVSSASLSPPAPEHQAWTRPVETPLIDL